MQPNLGMERPVQRHSVKCIQQFFDALSRGDKTFEVRYNDRDYRIGDIIVLNCILPEFPDMMMPHVAPISFKISYVLAGQEWGIQNGYVVLGLQRFT